MTIAWGDKLYPKYLSIQYCEWDKGEYKPIEFVRVPIGCAFNIGRLSICYDNYKNVKGDGVNDEKVFTVRTYPTYARL